MAERKENISRARNQDLKPSSTQVSGLRDNSLLAGFTAYPRLQLFSLSSAAIAQYFNDSHAPEHRSVSLS